MSIRRGLQDRWAGNTLADFERGLADNLCYERGTTAESASAQDAYWTLAITIRDRLADRRTRTAQANYEANPKFVYYLSAEYMLGRQLPQNAAYTGTADLARQAVAGALASPPETSRPSTLSPGWATAGSAGWPPACWTRWPPSTCRPWATASATSTGSSSRPSRMVIRSSTPTTGPSTATRGNFRAPDDRQVVGFYGHTEAVDDDQGGLRARWVPGRPCSANPATCWSPATAPRPSTSSGCGRPGPTGSRST